MTFLEICQSVVIEAGLSGDMVSVQNQSGDFHRVVNHVRAACQQIEGRYIDWRFLHGIHTFNTVDGIATYPVPEDLRVRQWDKNRAFLNGLQIDIYYADDTINYTKDPIAENYSARPIVGIIERNNDLRFIGVPDGEYSIEIEYYRMATILQENSDEPAVPVQFRNIIVFDALRRYANYDEAAELKQQAVEQIYGVGGNWVNPEPGSLLFQLQSDQLPNSLLHGASQGGGFVVSAE